MHILIYRDITHPNGPVVVEAYHSLNLAVLVMWQHRMGLIQFCIEHPFEDMLRLPIGDQEDG
jgi:hypothetical protein